jgi:hypothetical protein
VNTSEETAVKATKVVAAPVPIAIAEAIDEFDPEPGGKARFVRAAVIRAVRDRQRKRERRAAASGQETAA